MPELDKCPFCGGDGEIMDVYRDGDPTPPDGHQPPELWGWLCGCPACDVMFMADVEQGLDYAVALWNRRAHPVADLLRDQEPLGAECEAVWDANTAVLYEP